MHSVENAIEVRNLYKNFKVSYDKPQTLKERLVALGKRDRVERRTVLSNINVNIKKGETVALIGTNGSGKSTLLKLMTKILYPNKGEVETDGKLTSLLELGAGFHQDFTGRENIYFNASIFGLTRKEIDDRIDSIIAFSELGKFIDNPVRTYSSGMYMRLAFSVAINVDAEILLIDEILAVGDQHFQEKCFKRLEELRDSDRTIVIVSHNLNVIKQICSRAIWIYNGEVKLDSEPGEVIEAYLEQTAKDYEDIVIDKEENFDGFINIDAPVSFTKFDKEDRVSIYGWELSECLDSKVKVFFDGVELEEPERIERKDVFTIYENQYGGYKYNPYPGWGLTVNISDIELGSHSIRAVLYDKKGNELSYKEVTIYV